MDEPANLTPKHVQVLVFGRRGNDATWVTRAEKPQGDKRANEVFSQLVTGWDIDLVIVRYRVDYLFLFPVEMDVRPEQGFES